MTRNVESDTFIVVVSHNLHLCIYYPSSAQEVVAAARFTGTEEQGAAGAGAVLYGDQSGPHNSTPLPLFRSQVHWSLASLLKTTRQNFKNEIVWSLIIYPSLFNILRHTGE